MRPQVHDRMTEQVYLEPLKSFKSPVTPSPVFTVPVLEQGRRALEDINDELGLAFDEQVPHAPYVAANVSGKHSAALCCRGRSRVGHHW